MRLLLKQKLCINKISNPLPRQWITIMKNRVSIQARIQSMYVSHNVGISLKLLVKFSFSEKATKICAICLTVLTFAKYVNVKTIRQIDQIFVAFSEKLNFSTKLEEAIRAQLRRTSCDPTST